MADFLSSLFGGGQPDTGASTGPFDSGFGNRLDALFMAMASTPPGGAGGIPLLQATQVANQQGQLAAQRNAMTQALIMGGMDPKQAAILSWSPSAAQMATNAQASKQMAPIIAGMYNNTNPSGAPAATPAPAAQPAPTMPSLIGPTSMLSPDPLSQGGQAPAPPAPGPQPADAAVAAPTDTAPAQITVAPTKTVDPSAALNSTVPALAQRASQIAGIQQSSNGPVAVDAGGRPLFNVPGMARAAQVMMASPIKQYQEMGKSLQSQLETMQKTGVQFTTSGGVMPVPGYAEANARAKRMEEIATAGPKAVTSYFSQAGRVMPLNPDQAPVTGAMADPLARAGLTSAMRDMGINVPDNALQAPPPQQKQGQLETPQASPQGQPQQNAAVTFGDLPEDKRNALIPKQVNPYLAQAVQTPNGGVTNSVTGEIKDMAASSKVQYEESGKAAKSAYNVMMQLELMQDYANKLNANGWTKQGTGADLRAKLGMSVNTIAGVLGVPDNKLPFDAEALSGWQGMNKEATRMGFSLASTLGAKAMSRQVIGAAIAANPNTENTPQGFQVVKNAIAQAVQRDADLYDFQTRYFVQNHTLIGSETAFNKIFPPQAYAQKAIANANAINQPASPTSTPAAPPTGGPVDWRTYFGKQ